MKGKNKTKSTIQSIVSEIAHDLGIDKKLVRQVLLLTFKEIAVIFPKAPLFKFISLPVISMVRPSAKYL